MKRECEKKEAAKWNAIKSDRKMNRVSLKMCGFFLANWNVEVVSLQYQLGQSVIYSTINNAFLKSLDTPF